MYPRQGGQRVGSSEGWGEDAAAAAAAGGFLTHDLPESHCERPWAGRSQRPRHCRFVVSGLLIRIRRGCKVYRRGTARIARCGLGRSGWRGFLGRKVTTLELLAELALRLAAAGTVRAALGLGQ